MASFSASTQKSASILLDSRQLSTLRLYQSTPLGVCYVKACRAKDRHQIQKSAPHRCLTGNLQSKSAKRGDVGNINAPTVRQRMFTCARGGPDLADQTSAPGAGKGKSYAGGVSCWCLVSDKCECKRHSEMSPIAQSRNVTRGANGSAA